MAAAGMNAGAQDAVIAVLIATICMLLYIWFRFRYPLCNQRGTGAAA